MAKPNDTSNPEVTESSPRFVPLLPTSQADMCPRSATLYVDTHALPTHLFDNAKVRLRTLTVDQIAAAGVKRISTGGAMERHALNAFLRSAREMKDKGSFSYVRDMAPVKEVRAAFNGSVPAP